MAATYPVIVIHEAGLDGFWVCRVLAAEGIENHVVDAASIMAGFFSSVLDPKERLLADTQVVPALPLLHARAIAKL